MNPPIYISPFVFAFGYLAMTAALCADARMLRRQSAYSAFKSNETWAFSNAKTVYSTTMCCKDQALPRKMENVLETLAALRFCFSNLVLIVDVPHGGKKVETLQMAGHQGEVKVASFPGGPGEYAKFITSTSGKSLIAFATETAKRAAALLREHCPQHPHEWQVKVLNYDGPEMRSIFEHDSGERIDSNGFPYSSLYPNTMTYAQLWNLPDAQYVWHSDSDRRIWRVDDHASPNFIEQSINLMQSDKRVVMASPTCTQNVYPHGDFPGSVFHSSEDLRREGMFRGFFNRGDYVAPGGEVFNATWGSREKHATTYILRIQPVSTQEFLLDVQRFRSILPAPDLFTSTGIEGHIGNAIQPYDMHQVWFDESSGVIGSSGIR